jgi:BirA family biotin operon repressor/biotin-[acetyl-CoA-carboxylase] ligase
VLIAEHQSAGRGRLDRTWEAPPRAGLALSVLLRPYDVPVFRWPWLPLATGLAVAAAVREQAGVEAVVKWPNDVVVDERKLAGVLVERVEPSGGARAAAAVIGIGLNVSMTSEELPVPDATSLRLEDARTTDRTVLTKAVLRALAGVVGAWERTAGDPSGGLRDAYVAACTTIGRDVRIVLPGDETATGHAVGVDDHGRLLVDTDNGRRAFGAGDVVHVRPAS